MANRWNFEVRADCGVVSSESETKRILEIVMKAPTAKPAVDPLALNLALVLDRSGSMSGEPLEYVVRAACHVVDLLSERDMLTIVTFDDSVDILARATKMTSAAKKRLKTQLCAVASGGSTALHAGWTHGVHEVAAHLLERGINRCLLLTDGQANVGEDRVDVLISMAAEIAGHGIATSTFGVGVQFNHHLLEGMARGGRGSYYFIETPKQIPDLFRRELGELTSVVGRNASIEVSRPGGCKFQVISDVGQVKGQRSWNIPLHDVYSGEERRFYVEVMTPAALPESPVFSLRFQFEDSEGSANEIEESFAFSVASQIAAKAAPRDQELRRRATRVRAADATDQAMRLAATGKQKAAAVGLRAFVGHYAPMMEAVELSEVNDACEKLDEEALSAMEQKVAHSLSYQRRMSRER